jgi:hypothetical protein
MLYQITIQINTEDHEGWRRSYGVPTFYLDSAMQGIRTAKHAAEVGLHVVSSVGLRPDTTMIDVTACGPFDDAHTLTWRKPQTTDVDVNWKR